MAITPVTSSDPIVAMLAEAQIWVEIKGSVAVWGLEEGGVKKE